MMTTRPKILQALGMLGLLLFASWQAHAACTQTDATGVWFLYGISGNTEYGSLAETDYCKARINSAGTVVATGSSCIWRDHTGIGKIDITGGRVRLTAGCNLAGWIRICVGAACDSIRLQYGKLARDKNTFVYVGYATSNPDVVVFHEGVRH